MRYIVTVTGEVTSQRHRTMEVYADSLEEAKDKAENMFVKSSSKSQHFVKMGTNIRVTSIYASE